ncbi:efflux RND transporter periplasmic adaptor subunit [Paenibacillus aceris]|uniref:Macrolide-specific efflux system membrane fusion protein n=1 Tax=Paenibacillus aceris TaxID=869555 RepID=A0ABS4HXT5_9BACL|nr:efflux RND transporter periplasmic adaptor subunit [Paenibacillus aceris]MBP1963481.1 macrolide-specific efflux system membrane fusion protein [Paenibacillus aceris]NHW36747.1 efflux RND transporter periplasmic adaptor subunit [Paenibacillus aceris]
MRKKKTWILLLTAIIVCGISSFLYISSHPQAMKGTKTDTASAPSALQFKVTKEDLVNSVEVKGKSSYEKETRVYAPFGGEIKTWQITDGAQVKKGQLLFELDATPLKTEIASLQSNLKKQKLEADLAKFKAAGPEGETTNIPAGAVSEDDARSRFASSEGRKIQEQLNQVNDESIQLQLAKKQEKVEQAAFAAPDDGIFLFEDSSKIPKSVEESARIGKIVDLTKLQLVCTVGEFDVFRIKPGMSVQVKVEALKQKKLQGKVEKVSKFAKAGTDQGSASAQFEVTISLEPDEQLIAGLSLSGTIETEKKNGATVVPTLAVMHEKDVYYVMLQTSQGAERREIEIGMETPEKTEVIKGLQEGDTVVLQ